MATKPKTKKCPRCNGKGTILDAVEMGKHMKALRLKAGLFTTEVATRMGVDQSLISLKEAGRRQWSPEFRRRYLEALKQ